MADSKITMGFKISPELRMRLRIYCLRNNISVTEYLEQLITNDLDEKEKEAEKRGEMVGDWLTY